MLPDDQIEMLRCPDDHSALLRADSTLLSAVNRRIQARQLQNRAGETLAQPIEQGLVRAKGDVLYPVADGIPRLLIEEGIEVSEIQQGNSGIYRGDDSA